MNKKNLFLKKMLPAALALGTAWAARGQIGHEYGAAWAGGIGVLACIVLSGRKDWYSRLPVIAALGAIAWGISGIISYGKVVGYGHAADYLNTSYGLLMLLFIGAMYGFIGGGITGLALESTAEKKVDWPALFTQMFAGGFLFWGLLINELEYFMTPPRSEMWAASLGISLALGWYMYRNGYAHALRTAFFSALGAGFGFAFGNFLQRIGQASGISFNWWNVMEYSIGFSGGLGMAYGIFSSDKWPETIKANKLSNRIAWVFLIVLLPAICIIESIDIKTMTKLAESLQAANTNSFAITWVTVAWIMSFIFMLLIGFSFKPFWKSDNEQKKTLAFTLLLLVWYILISNFISGTWLAGKFSSQHLYWANLIALFFLLQLKTQPSFSAINNEQGSYSSLLIKCWIAAFLIILLVSYIAVASGHANPSAQLRFG